MRFITPEIAWHNRDPVYSLDIQPSLSIRTSPNESAKSAVPFLPGVNADSFLTLPALTYGAHPPKGIKSDQVETLTYRIASAGSDSTVVVWRATVTFCHPAQKIKIDPVAQLTRHENAVNVVRFVPTGEDMFASASVDRCIIIWKRADENGENILSSPPKLSRSESPSKPVEEKTSPTSKDGPVPMEIDEEAKPVPPNVLKIASKSGNRIALTTLSTSTSINTSASAESQPPPPLPNASFSSGQDLICEEQWTQWRTFRGHLEDVVDISWSSDGSYLLSGSVDNEAILWDVNKGTRVAFLSGHKGWVQGVAIDPLNNYLVTMSSDRIMRVFNFADRKIAHKVEKAPISISALRLVDTATEDAEDLMSFVAASHSRPRGPSAGPNDSASLSVPAAGKGDSDQLTTKLFYDYTMQSFARRLFFSPNGEFLLVPSGVIEFPKPEKDKKDTSKDKKENLTSGPDEKAKDKGKEPLDRCADGENTPKGKSANGGDCGTAQLSSPSSRQAGAKVTTPTASKLTSINHNTPRSAKSKQTVHSALPPADPSYINVCHVFDRSNLAKPVAYFPLHNNYCHAVRFCPVKFALMQDGGESLGPHKPASCTTFPLAYRLVFAIATHKSVLIYDTQHQTPIAYLNEIHYTRITDLAWSLDGRLLIISSTDGFVTFVTFEHGELGQVYKEPPPSSQQPEVKVAAQLSTSPTSSQSSSQTGPQSSAQLNIRQLFAAMGRASSGASPSAANFSSSIISSSDPC